MTRFVLISEDEMIDASIDSFYCDYRKMEVLLAKAIR